MNKTFNVSNLNKKNVAIEQKECKLEMNKKYLNKQRKIFIHLSQEKQIKNQLLSRENTYLLVYHFYYINYNNFIIVWCIFINDRNILTIIMALIGISFVSGAFCGINDSLYLFLHSHLLLLHWNFTFHVTGKTMESMLMA